MTTKHDELESLEQMRNYPGFAGLTQLKSPRELLEAAETQSRDYVVSRSAAEALRALIRTAASARSSSGHAMSDVATASDAHSLSIISDVSAAVASLGAVLGLQDKDHGRAHDVLLAPIEEQVKDLAAARFQRQLMGPPSIVISRTLAAVGVNMLLAAQAEGCDQAFVLGTTELTLPPLADCQLAHLQHLGMRGSEASAQATAWLAAHPGESFVEAWQQAANLRTFGEAVAELMNWPIMDSTELPMPPAAWREYSRSRPLLELREHADVLGILPTWDCEHARSVEGYCYVRGSIDYAIVRSLAAAPYADLLWLVAATPDLNDARRFAEALRDKFPGKWLAYQLTSSGEAALASQGSGAWQRFSEELQTLGFVLHVTTQDSVAARELRDPVRLIP